MSNKSDIRKLNEGLLVAQEAQEEKLVVDFDEAWKEEESEKTFLVRFNGCDFEVPQSPPAAFALFYLRHCLKKTGPGKFKIEMPEDRAYEFMEKLLGQEFIEAIAESNVSMRFLQQTIIVGILRQWGLDVEPEGDSGN